MNIDPGRYPSSHENFPPVSVPAKWAYLPALVSKETVLIRSAMKITRGLLIAPSTCASRLFPHVNHMSITPFLTVFGRFADTLFQKLTRHQSADV
jgi:hypothetical protein